MTSTAYEIRRGTYHDSVVLMQLQRGLLSLPGVLDAGAVMATPANIAILTQSGLLTEGIPTASPEDLLIVVQARSKADAEAALAQVADLLSKRPSSMEKGFNPRSLDAALKILPDSKWVLISVPGKYATRVAKDALRRDRNVFLYSDNVNVQDEVLLKKEASAKGLLVMGPDCGTAIINGIGFGFANHVRRGPIGLVGATGTGLQAILSKIHQLGSGVSHAIGSGGRDLRSEVQGITAMQGMDLLQRDPDTKVIVLVSKPPDSDVASQTLTRIRKSVKPVVVQFMGFAPTTLQSGNLHFSLNFGMTALKAVGLAESGSSWDASEMEQVNPPENRRFMRGLFSGGSLANEVLQALQLALHPLYSNIPLRESQRLPDPFVSQGHTILDLGADKFTIGRLHPMMDYELRIRFLRKEAADPEVTLILMDIVLGEGAHPDPAGEMSGVITEVIRDYSVELVIILVGTDEDPQDFQQQKLRLTEAGARVFEDSLQAVEYIHRKIQVDSFEQVLSVPLEVLHEPVAAINVGLETFYQSLIAQGASAVHVDWRPPAGGDEEMLSILEKMRS